MDKRINANATFDYGKISKIIGILLQKFCNKRQYNKQGAQ